MMGMMVNGKRIMRAYSMASATYDDHLEWVSIKLEDGPLTSHLQNIKVGDTILRNNKSTGTLVNDHLLGCKFRADVEEELHSFKRPIRKELL